jgi:hypothetical protein
MLGHTDTKTINQRRPLTTNMKLLLADLLRDRTIRKNQLDQSDANVMRALMDRGYATWDVSTSCYSITPEGETALTGTKP